MFKLIGWALLALMLSLLAPPAHAQACAPAEVAGATGQPLRTGTTATGWYAFTFCPGDYAVGYWYAYGTWAAVLPAAVAEIHAARAGMEAFRAAVALRLNGRQCVIERDAEGVQAMVEAEAWGSHSALCFALRDAMRAAWPPMPVWRVVPLLTGDGSRPLYPVVNGVRSSTAVRTPRAPADALCRCTSATALPSTTNRRWCPVVDRPADLVTLCGRGQ
jgi:hypothetical protein